MLKKMTQLGGGTAFVNPEAVVSIHPTNGGASMVAFGGDAVALAGSPEDVHAALFGPPAESALATLRQAVSQVADDLDGARAYRTPAFESRSCVGAAANDLRSALASAPAPEHPDTAAQEEGGMVELLELVRRPDVDTLLRMESEGGRVFVVDAEDVREMADASDALRAIRERAKDENGVRRAVDADMAAASRYGVAHTALSAGVAAVRWVVGDSVALGDARSDAGKTLEGVRDQGGTVPTAWDNTGEAGESLGAGIAREQRQVARMDASFPVPGTTPTPTPEEDWRTVETYCMTHGEDCAADMFGSCTCGADAATAALARLKDARSDAWRPMSEEEMTDLMNKGNAEWYQNDHPSLMTYLAGYIVRRLTERSRG